MRDKGGVCGGDVDDGYGDNDYDDDDDDGLHKSQSM
jgi:hypothetical protein